MANIYHSLDALLPWQWPIPKKQNLKNKGNYDNNNNNNNNNNNYYYYYYYNNNNV